MYKRGLCALCLLTTVGMSVSAQQIRTSYFMQSSTARTTMNPAYRPERGYVSIPVLGAVGASYGISAGFPLLDDHQEQQKIQFSTGSRITRLAVHTECSLSEDH